MEAILQTKVDGKERKHECWTVVQKAESLWQKSKTKDC